MAYSSIGHPYAFDIPAGKTLDADLAEKSGFGYGAFGAEGEESEAAVPVVADLQLTFLVANMIVGIEFRAVVGTRKFFQRSGCQHGFLDRSDLVPLVLNVYTEAGSLRVEGNPVLLIVEAVVLGG